MALTAIVFIASTKLRDRPKYQHVAIYMGDEPLWPWCATLVAQRDAQWWTNILFVNNHIPLKQPFGETGWLPEIASTLKLVLLSIIIGTSMAAWTKDHVLSGKDPKIQTVEADGPETHGHFSILWLGQLGGSDLL
eukprot:15037360-Ditylum_brightwellii.AAC.1